MSNIDAIAQNAKATGLQLSVAESLTCGLLASAIGAGKDAGEWFRGGIIAYQGTVKEKVLGVQRGIDPCSAECAEQLAIGARSVLGADIAVSTTGAGGPDSKDGHPPGMVYIGWATETGVGHRLLQLHGDPETIITGTVDAAKKILLELL